MFLDLEENPWNDLIDQNSSSSHPEVIMAGLGRAGQEWVIVF